MLEYVFDILIICTVCVPLLYYCKYLLDGKRQIGKKELIFAFVILIVLAMLWIVRLVNYGNNLSIFEICLGIAAIVEIYVYMKQQNQ